MKMLKGWIPTTGFLIGILMFGATFAQAGTVVIALADTNSAPCTNTAKTNWDVITSAITGTVVIAFTGTVVIAYTETSGDCGTTVTD